jgi:hypothetical protein
MTGPLINSYGFSGLVTLHDPMIDCILEIQSSDMHVIM